MLFGLYKRVIFKTIVGAIKGTTCFEGIQIEFVCSVLSGIIRVLVREYAIKHYFYKVIIIFETILQEYFKLRKRNNVVNYRLKKITVI